jgi:uracil phosphoribosyltransferase
VRYRKLVDASVDQASIVFVTVVVASEGVRRVLGAYPSIVLSTASVAIGLNQMSYIKCSVGGFVDRYFTE